MTKYAYKWLLPNRITPTQKSRWPVEVGGWAPKAKPILCVSGWHGMAEKYVLTHLPSTIGAELWWVEYRGEVVHGDNKFSAEQMRLVSLVGVTTDQNLRLFACDVAEDALGLIENPNPRSLNAIAVSRRYANGEATREELSAAYWAAYAEADSARSANSARSAAYWATYSAAYCAADWATNSASWAARSARSAARSARSAARTAYSNWLVVRLESGY